MPLAFFLMRIFIALSIDPLLLLLFVSFDILSMQFSSKFQMFLSLEF